MKHTKAVLKLPRRAGDVLVFAKHVSSSMRDNPSFPSPRPPLPALDGHIAELDAAHSAVLERTAGNAAVRDDRLDVVVADLENERAYVQEVANEDPATAAAVIASAGMYVRRFTMRALGDLVVLQGRVSGTVRLVARSAGDRACYEWEWSTDETTWTRLPMTRHATTQVSGLTEATRYYFRVRITRVHERRDWSDPVSLVVV